MNDSGNAINTLSPTRHIKDVSYRALAEDCAEIFYSVSWHSAWRGRLVSLFTFHWAKLVTTAEQGIRSALLTDNSLIKKR